MPGASAGVGQAPGPPVVAGAARQVFHPSAASTLAVREKRRRDAVLVACFGDSDFVWADAPDLLPFCDGLPRLADMGGRSFTRFTPALDDTLDEVSRRVHAGLSCGCCAATIKNLVFVNSGIRRGARGAAVDADFVRDVLVGRRSSGTSAHWWWRRRPVGAMVVERAARVHATTPRRNRTKRGGDHRDTPAGEPTLSMCARVGGGHGMMRHMISCEALKEYASTMAMTPPPLARAKLRDLDVASQHAAAEGFRPVEGYHRVHCNLLHHRDCRHLVQPARSGSSPSPRLS